MASIAHELPVITRQTIWKKSVWRHARIPVLFMIAFGLVCLVSLPYLLFDSRSNNMTFEIRRLSQRRQDLRHDISELQRQLAAAQSLSSVSRRAAALGFQQATEVNILAVEIQRESMEDQGSTLHALASGIDQLRSFLQPRNENPSNLDTGRSR